MKLSLPVAGLVKREVVPGPLPLLLLLPDPRPMGPCSRRVLVGLASEHRGSQTRAASGPCPGPPVRMTSVLGDIRQSAFLRWAGKAIIPWQRAGPRCKAASLERSLRSGVSLGPCLP